MNIKSDYNGKSNISVRVNIHVATKTITIKEEVYLELIKLKQDDESFSDLLERLTQSVNPLNLLKEMAGTLDLGDTSDLKRDIRSKRQEIR